MKLLGDYPKKPQKWGIASGRGDGHPSTPREQLFAWTDSPWIKAELYSLPAGNKPETIAEGSWILPNEICSTLKLTNGVSWETVQGSYATYAASLYFGASLLAYGTPKLTKRKACVVPTISALAYGDTYKPNEKIPRAPSPQTFFDDYIFASENLEHIEISSEICDWILARVDELGPSRRVLRSK